MKKVFAFLILLLSCLFPLGCNSVPQNRQTYFSSEDVAVLNIFSYDGKGESKYGIKNLGHSFLSITNTNNESIFVAGKEIKAGEELYFGTWSLSLHFGVWFNVECNYIELYNKYNGRISLAKGVTITDLNKISEYILNNDTWNPLKNCSHFAISVWNSVARESERLNLGFINTPGNLKNQILNFETYVLNKEIINAGDCGYFADLTEDAFVFEGGEIYV